MHASICHNQQPAELRLYVERSQPLDLLQIRCESGPSLQVGASLEGRTDSQS